MYDLPTSKEKEAHGHHDLHIQRKTITPHMREDACSIEQICMVNRKCY